MKSEYENILHRDLLMAVRCLADDIRVDAELRRTVLSQLLKVYFAPKSSPTLQNDIRQACSRLSGTIFGVKLSKKLAECLSNRRKSIRRAALALGQLGVAAATPEVLTTLLHALADPDINVRWIAAWALGQLGVAAATPEVLTTLLHALANPDAGVRVAAAWALGQLGVAAATPEVLITLLHALADPDINVRWIAAWALGELGAAAATPEVLTVLLHALADPDANVRVAAAWALEHLGAAAATPQVLTALLHALADTAVGVRQGVRQAAARGLQRLSGYVRLPDRSVMVKLILPLARSNDAESRDVGYVSLRNLLATEPVSDESHALVGLSE
jgi:3-methyladenine DNA glycosylase AlkD